MGSLPVVPPEAKRKTVIHSLPKASLLKLVYKVRMVISQTAKKVNTLKTHCLQKFFPQTLGQNALPAVESHV